VSRLNDRYRWVWTDPASGDVWTVSHDYDDADRLIDPTGRVTDLPANLLLAFGASALQDRLGVPAELDRPGPAHATVYSRKFTTPSLVQARELLLLAHDAVYRYRPEAVGTEVAEALAAWLADAADGVDEHVSTEPLLVDLPPDVLCASEHLALRFAFELVGDLLADVDVDQLTYETAADHLRAFLAAATAADEELNRVNPPGS
jgi:hypothetical protein